MVVDQPAPGQPWRDWEIELLVSAYFDLLAAESRGERPVKADINRRLQELLPSRTRGSIEYKLQNVSAVLHEQRVPFIDGYKPALNYQEALRRAVLQRIEDRHAVVEELEAYANSAPASPPLEIRLRDVLVERPEAGSRRTRSGLSISQGEWGAHRDAQLRRLGEAGERWVLGVERAELRANGRDDLAEQVEWTSRDRGDGFGYDVASFQPDGSPTHIEVKTTNLGARAPFFVTRNEVRRSAELSSTYRVYRVFHFGREPRLFVVPGSVADTFAIQPAVYEARLG